MNCQTCPHQILAGKRAPDPGDSTQWGRGHLGQSAALLGFKYKTEYVTPLGMSPFSFCTFSFLFTITYLLIIFLKIPPSREIQQVVQAWSPRTLFLVKSQFIPQIPQISGQLNNPELWPHWWYSVIFSDLNFIF